MTTNTFCEFGSNLFQRIKLKFTKLGGCGGGGRGGWSDRVEPVCRHIIRRGLARAALVQGTGVEVVVVVDVGVQTVQRVRSDQFSERSRLCDATLVETWLRVLTVVVHVGV